ncbi:MAG: hypothetical protein ABMA64_43180, partial [Myxococcota bacterium]
GVVFAAGSAWMLDLAGPGAPSRTSASLSVGFGFGPGVAGLATLAPGSPLLVPYAIQLPVSLLTLLLAASVRVPVRRRDAGPPRRPGVGRWFVRVALVAPWIFAFPSVAFVTLAGGVSAGPPFVGLVAAVTLFSGAIAARAATRTRAATAVAAGAAGLVVGALAVGAASLTGVVGAAVLLGFGHGVLLARSLEWLAAEVDDRARGRAVGATYVVAYSGFAAPWLLAVLGGSPAALLGAAALAALTAALHAGLAWARPGP